jgi:hypothetical protein
MSGDKRALFSPGVKDGLAAVGKMLQVSNFEKDSGVSRIEFRTQKVTYVKLYWKIPQISLTRESCFL